MSLTRVMAAEVRPTLGIRVNAIAPGMTRTLIVAAGHRRTARSMRTR